MASEEAGVLRAVGHVPLWAWSLPLLLCLALGVRGGLRLARLVLARRPRRARRLGAVGARRAGPLLAREGWRVLATEVSREGWVEVDGRPEPFLVRADALVEGHGGVWVAEVKAGVDSSTIRHRATRRQLLEYAHVFGAAGVLLVDTRRDRVHAIRFAPPDAPSEGPSEGP